MKSKQTLGYWMVCNIVLDTKELDYYERDEIDFYMSDPSSNKSNLKYAVETRNRVFIPHLATQFW